MAHATITDVYGEYQRDYMSHMGDEDTPRTQDEIQAAVQASVGRYERVDADWWLTFREEWLYGIGEPREPFSDNAAANIEYARLADLRGF